MPAETFFLSIKMRRLKKTGQPSSRARHAVLWREEALPSSPGAVTFWRYSIGSWWLASPPPTPAAEEREREMCLDTRGVLLPLYYGSHTAARASYLLLLAPPRGVFLFLPQKISNTALCTLYRHESHRTARMHPDPHTDTNTHTHTYTHLLILTPHYLAAHSQSLAVTVHK